MSRELKRGNGRCFPGFAGICLLLALAVGLTGCSTLKKKFTRKKKKTDTEAAEFVPVLQPEEYPEKVASPAELYKYNYSMWQVWEKELQTSLAEGESQKRKEYLLNQLIVAVEAMSKLLVAEKQKGMMDLQSKLLKVRDDLARPAAMRNDTEIKRQVGGLGKKLREGYKLPDVQNNLISAEAAAGMSL